MNFREAVDGLSVMSLRTLSLAGRNRSNLRSYVGYCLRRYDELANKGLPLGSPAPPAASDTITLPAAHAGGGMSFAEMVIMARVTKSRRPRTVFEMGSYNGLTTAIFLLNPPADARNILLTCPQSPPPKTTTWRATRHWLLRAPWEPSLAPSVWTTTLAAVV